MTKVKGTKRKKANPKSLKKESLKRKYTDPVLKQLFGFSGNQCAHPDCTNNIIVRGTDCSPPAVVGHICHIYAINENGPRGRTDLTEEQLNALDNLILCCGHHHPIIDKQHETYPADLLKQWKSVHEEKVAQLLCESATKAHPDVYRHNVFPKLLINDTIEERLDQVRKSRFYAEFDRLAFVHKLARDLTDGELAGGEDERRCVALAWCSRLMAADNQDLSRDYLSTAKLLGSGDEVTIAEGFLHAYSGHRPEAMKLLAGLETAESRTAALMIVANNDGLDAGEQWLSAADVTLNDLSSDGKYFLLSKRLMAGKWDLAASAVGSISESDTHNTPVLHRAVASALLAQAIPEEYRQTILEHLPVDPSGFPLASDPAGMKLREQAISEFIKAAEIERVLGCIQAAQMAEDYVLWLKLKSPDTNAVALAELKNRLENPRDGLRLVSLGITFGLGIDRQLVEREITREITLHGGITPDAAMARLALCLGQPTPPDALHYFEIYQAELSEVFDESTILMLKLELLCKSGISEEAKSCITELKSKGIPDNQLARFMRHLSSVGDTNSVDAYLQNFKESNDLRDLVSLVDELEKALDWKRLIEFAALLFERTRTAADFKRYATALFNGKNYGRLISLARDNASFLLQSKYLRLLYAWALFNEGLLLDARCEVKKLPTDYDDARFRALQINLALAMGDWNSLGVIISNEFEVVSERSAPELLGLAKLAYHASSPYAKDFLYAAANKEPDNAQILAGAYFLATESGLEDNEKVGAWLSKAAEMSDEDGPIKKVSVDEIIERKPSWDNRTSDIWQKLSQGHIPNFLAAKALNQTLVKLTLHPALASLKERDPRRRALVSAYSGKRAASTPAKFKVVGIDASALLTLSLLGLLDKTFDFYDTVYIPHATLTWLFSEKNAASFHQPSRVKQAHQIRHLLSVGSLTKLNPRFPVRSDLTALVGDEIAQLISEASGASDESKGASFVVRPSPVHQVGSLMNTEADLSDYSTCLCSCQALVSKLYAMGHVSEDEYQRSIAYLRLHEKPWQNQPDISPASTLYLDGVAVSYFMHLGLLEKISDAGFKIVVSEREVSDMNELLSFELSSGKVKEVIEDMRAALNKGIESAKIKIGKRMVPTNDTDVEDLDHPTMGIFSLVDQCEAMVVDDRYLNGLAKIRGAAAAVPVITTYEILNSLADSEVIRKEELYKCRMQLRQAGYCFVPVELEELSFHLQSSPVHQGVVTETVGLRAIRESILRVRMSDWLVLPDEAQWIEEFYKSGCALIKRVWSNDGDIESMTAKADWLVELLDIRGWAHRFLGGAASELGNTGRITHIATIIYLPPSLPHQRLEEYWKWIDSRFVIPIKEEFPSLFALLLDWYKSYIDHFVSRGLKDDLEGENNE